MKQILIILTILVLNSCMPQKPQDSEQSKENSTEISRLEEEIRELNEKLNEKQKSDQSEMPTDVGVNEQEMYAKINKDIESLRNELNGKINELDKKLDLRISALEGSYITFIGRLDNLENKNYVSLELFEAMKKNIDDNFAKKTDIINIQIKNSDDPVAIRYLTEKISQLQNSQDRIELNYQSYFKKALKAWSDKLLSLIEKKIEGGDKELKQFIQAELARLNVNIETLTKRIIELELIASAQRKLNKILLKNTKQNKKDDADQDLEIKKLREQINALKSTVSYPAQADYSSEIEILKEKVILNQNLLSKLKFIARNQINDSLISDIIEKQFAPCKESLKDNPYCYTIGTMITKLGGQFIDPTGYARTRNDFIKYLVASGVTLKSVLNYPSKFLKPSDDEGKEKIRSCHPGTTHSLLGPQEVWPRAVLLSLILEKVENEINKLKELNLIDPAIFPATQVNSWWRSSCYQGRFKAKDSDHMYGAAFDPQMENFKSLEYYKDFIQTHIFNSDTFGLTHPLKSSGLIFRTGFGAGHKDNDNKKLHLGIGSKQKLHGNNVGCKKWEYTEGNNFRSLPGGCSH